MGEKARSKTYHGSQRTDCSGLPGGCGFLSAMLDSSVLWINGGKRFDARRFTHSMEVCNGKKTEGFNNRTHHRKKCRETGNEQ